MFPTCVAACQVSSAPPPAVIRSQPPEDAPGRFPHARFVKPEKPAYDCMNRFARSFPRRRSGPVSHGKRRISTGKSAAERCKAVSPDFFGFRVEGRKTLKGGKGHGEASATHDGRRVAGPSRYAASELHGGNRGGVGSPGNGRIAAGKRPAAPRSGHGNGRLKARLRRLGPDGGAATSNVRVTARRRRKPEAPQLFATGPPNRAVEAARSNEPRM